MFIFVFCFSCIFFVPGTSCAGETASSTVNPQKVQTALRSSTRSLGLQTQFPVGNKKMKAEDYRLDGRWALAPSIAGLLFFCSLAAIAVVVFRTWRDNVWSSSRARRLGRSVDESASAAETVERMEKAQAEADELARQGYYAEAMHTLLLRSVNELRRHLRVSIAASLTSREILSHVGLPSEGRPVFADIINRVEISYFGAHSPEEDDYRACRNSFDALTDVLRRYSAQSGYLVS